MKSHHRTLLALTVASLSTATQARFLPSDAIWTVPRMSSFTPLPDSSLPQSERTLRKGDTVFRVHISPPKIAKIQSSVTVKFGNTVLPIESGWQWAPFETVDEGRPMFCSEGEGSSRKLIRAALGSGKAYLPRICLADKNDDGFFDTAVLDANFPQGGVAQLARAPVQVGPLAYSLLEHPDQPSGDFDVYFRGFPIQGDRLTLGLRQRGTHPFRFFSEFLLNSGSGFWYYYAEYFFPRYNPGGSSIMKVLGTVLQVSNVDRAGGIMHVSLKEQRAGKIYYLSAAQALPEYRYFEGSE